MFDNVSEKCHFPVPDLNFRDNDEISFDDSDDGARSHRSISASKVPTQSVPPPEVSTLKRLLDIAFSSHKYKGNEKKAAQVPTNRVNWENALHATKNFEFMQFPFRLSQDDPSGIATALEELDVIRGLLVDRRSALEREVE